MACEDFIYSKQSALQTWVTPAKAISVESVGIESARENLNLNVTGACRAPLLTVLGAKPVTMPLVTPWWMVNIGTLLSTLMTTVTTTAAGASYDHALLFNDTAAHGSISGQVKYKSDLAVNVLGATINSLTISAAIKEAVKLTFGFSAKDEAPAAGLWDFDGSASAAVVASPTYATLQRPLMFYDAAIVMGGTPALNGTTKKLSLGSGTSYTKLSSAEITINPNLDEDGYGLVADPTVQELYPGNREIGLTFDISWTDYVTTFYTAARAGTAMAFEMTLTGPIIETTNHYEAHICIPSVHFDPANLPPISGDKSRKMLSISGTAQTDTVTGVDFGIWIRTSEATL